MKGLRRNLYRLNMAIAITVPVVLLAPMGVFAQTPGAPGAPAAQGAPGAAYTPNPRAVSLYNLGLTAHKQGSPESAIIFFKRACDIDPNLADAQYNLGVLYQMQKRFKEAIPRFEEVLRIKPTDPDAHFQLGIILQDSGRLAEARQHFSAIAPNSSHFTESQRRIGLINSGQVPAAAADANPPANNYQQPPQQSVQQPGALRDPGYSTPTDQMQSPGTGTAYGQMPAQQAMQQPSYQQPPAQQPPATAYIPPSAPTPPVSTGPVPVMPNSTLRVIATGFSAPSGLAFDRNGSLYVANYMTNSIDRIGPDGTRNTFCTGVNLRGPIGLVVDEANSLFVANYNSGTVVKVSPAGISTVIASGFRKPYYLTLDKDGNLYVSQQEDNSIVRIVLPRTVGARTP